MKRKIVKFEKSNYGGLRMNCNTEKRRQFVEDLMQIIEKSDYIKRLYAIDRENRINDGPQ